MSDNDDIERLLREVDGVTGARPPAARSENAPQKSSRSTSQGAVLAISAVLGVVGLLLGFLPMVPGLWLGLGAFLGSYLGLTIGGRFG
ncbi:MAG TPA: hypothetical protein PLT68_09865 [Actinomycetota bacterium]|nr:hypothetical protein [Actinomycetota bacterium]